MAAASDPHPDRWRSLERDLVREVDGEVRFDSTSRALYDCDGSNYRHLPIGVVIPRSTEAVVAAVAACHRHGAPLVSRGAGTGLAGGAVNAAIVIDFSKHLNRILEIDAERKIARVQPGVVLDDLRQRAAKYQLTYGPDPATHTHSTFGGMLGNNSCGIHSVMAGRTADNAHRLDVLTYDGLRLQVGETSDDALERYIAEGGRRGEIYAAMRAIRDRYGDPIRQRYPDIPRRVSGYNLDDLLPEKGFHVARTLVGSEGTLVTILEATVRLVYSWPGRSLVVLGYPDVYRAGDHIPDIMAHGPVGLEGLDDRLVGFNEKKDMNLKRLKLLPQGGGWLLVEMGGHDRAEAEDKARRLIDELKKSATAPEIKLFTDPEESEQLWTIRESGLGATANVPGEPLAWPGWEDAAVPPEKVGAYLRDFRKLMDDFGYDAALYGHFGQGCIHCRITFDLFTAEGVGKYRAFVERASDLVASYGGSFSGEHGDGQSRSVLLEKLYGPELITAFRELKAAWDPHGKMNPGKVVDPYAPDENLRLGADYRPWEADTFFKFPDDRGSFSRAALRCVGVGKCRRPGEVFMCPSWLATRDEKDTTRGRARALFEMFRGDFIRDRWASEEVRETLELCLSCKGCKSECPVNVDMATYKMEFLYHHYRERPRPAHHYVLGFLGAGAGLGSRLPGLTNGIAQSSGLGGLLKSALGLAAERPLPRFAEETFVKWFRRQRPRVGADARPVLLYPDVFNNCFEPEVLKAALRVLEHWDYRVLIPDRTPPATLPLMHFGFLDRGGRELRECVRILLPYARQGMPILFAEPSMAVLFKEDLPNAMPNDPDVQRVIGCCAMVGEHIAREGLDLPRIEGKGLLHLHCNQKAVLDAKAIGQMLRQTGLEVSEPEPGCCGMAGSFGYVREHYPVSMQIAERHLLPAVRTASPETFVLAEGFSCRSQIRDGTGRTAIHPLKLLDRAFQGRL